MKIFYTLSFILLVASSCSKDSFKSYDRRIIGTWDITDVDKNGFGGSINDLPFREGHFTFNSDGTLSYTNSTGNFSGTWDIRTRSTDDQTYHTLQITAVNFATQQVLGEYFDDINFVSTNHIKARIYNNLRTYVVHLRR